MKSIEVVETKPEPEPMLVRFLGKYSVSNSEIVDGEILVLGIDRESKKLKIVRKSITTGEIDEALRWLVRNPNSQKNNSLFNFNITNLQDLRSEVLLPTEPLL